MTTKTEVVGASQFSATMGAAARDMRDLGEAGERAGQLVVSAASSAAPRRTGALAGSITAEVTPTEVVVSSPLSTYPAIQEYGSRYVTARPFLRPALADNEDRILALYEKQADAALSHVKGA